MLLALSVALIALAFVIGLAALTGVLTPDMLRTVLAPLRTLGTRVTARVGGNNGNCTCLACHHFRNTTLPTATRHKLLPLKVGKVVDELINDVQDFLAEQEHTARG